MRTIELLAGTSIQKAAETLVQHAPAAGDFNGVRIRARYATTRPTDIVREYRSRCELRAITYRHSDAWKRAEVERLERNARNQAIVDACKAKLSALPLSSSTIHDLHTVLKWCARIAEASDWTGVVLDKEAVRERFSEYGWQRGAYCEAEFIADDPRAVAGYIVGQWLECWYPAVDMFLAKWRAQFLPDAA